MANFTKLAGAGLAALLLSNPALAQMVWEDERCDTDGDDLFSLEEFREGFRERINFAEWDAESDGLLTEEEFGGGVYDRYDRDRTEAFEGTEYGSVERDFGERGFWKRRSVTDVETTASDGVVEEDADRLATGGAEVIGDEESPAESDAEVICDDEHWAADTEIAGNEALDDVAAHEGRDSDGDGVLLGHEFQDGFREWGTFGEFDVDRDGGVTEDELTEGIFTRYDEDGTGLIEEPELTELGDDVGDDGFFDV